MRMLALRLVLGAAILAVPGTMDLARPRIASADCGRLAPSREIRDYRGQAFMGRVRSVERQAAPGNDWVITLDVDEVLVGPVPDSVVFIDSGPDCGTFLPDGLRSGQRILASIGPAHDPDEPRRAFDVLLWRRVTGGWRFHEQALWAADASYAYPPEARRATTRAAIMALVAGASVPYPTVTCPGSPTDPIDAEPGASGSPTLLPARPTTVVPASTTEAPSASRGLGGRWRSMPRSPFASESATGAWTGTEAVFVGAPERRAAAYDPVRRRWRTLSRPPVRLGFDATATWTGSEVVVIGSTRRSVAAIAYDPARDRWRRLPDAPEGQEVTSVAAVPGGIVIGRDGATSNAVSILDLDRACWRSTALPPFVRADARFAAAGDRIVVAGSPWSLLGPRNISVLDRVTGSWGDPVAVPLDEVEDGPAWVGGDQLLVTGEVDGARGAAILDVATGDWRVLTGTRCTGITQTPAIWTGHVLLGRSAALDPSSGQCFDLPARRDRGRRHPAVVWTGRELLVWSGGGAEELPALADGMTYRSPAGVRR